MTKEPDRNGVVGKRFVSILFREQLIREEAGGSSNGSIRGYRSWACHFTS